MKISIASKTFSIIFWAVLLGVSAYFYNDNAISYLYGYRSERFGENLLNNQIWFIVHIAGATCTLFIGPIQFWTWFRNRYLTVHRLLGKLYIIGTLAAGIAALRLSAVNDCRGCRYSLLLLSILLIFFTGAAYYSIRAREIDSHKQFMARSYVCGLAFVFVRLPQILPMDPLFGWVEAGETRRVVSEWFFSLVPLLIVEMWITWLPSLRKAYNSRKVAM